MNYFEEMMAVATVKELFEFRQRCKNVFDFHSSMKEDDIDTRHYNAIKCQEASFWIRLSEERIKRLAGKGVSLDSIQEPKGEVKIEIMQHLTDIVTELFKKERDGKINPTEEESVLGEAAV